MPHLVTYLVTWNVVDNHRSLAVSHYRCCADFAILVFFVIPSDDYATVTVLPNAKISNATTSKSSINLC